MFAYHVVTERPMYVGQRIIFDNEHHNGVYQRVYDKLDTVNDIYKNPDKYDADALEHHTSVALRELALEEIRCKKFPQYPSRMGCLYVSETLESAERWAGLFSSMGRMVYHIVKLDIQGNWFIGDATKCFNGRTSKEENLRLAEIYWKSRAGCECVQTIREMLVDGQITVIEIVREINANVNL